jgi:hypothetical protein
MTALVDNTFRSIDFYRLSNNLLGKNEKDLRGVFYQLDLAKANTNTADLNQKLPEFLNEDTLIDKAIAKGIISPETYEVRRRLFDNVEGFKIWRDIGMSIGNTIKTILPNAYWMRGLVEQGQHLGYAGIEGQCKAAMSEFDTIKYTCAYCGYSETSEDRAQANKHNGKNDGLEPVVFSCEHIIELGAMFLVSGIMIGSDILKKKDRQEAYLRDLYRPNYEMACCRCNYLKADIQVNKSLVPESSTGEPTIFVGWNPIGKKFYVNTIAITKFAELVMCYDLRVKGMKGYKNMQAYLTALGTIQEAKGIIYKKTVLCVKKCVDNLNNKIILVHTNPGEIPLNYKLEIFNPLLLRICFYYKVFKKTQNIKVKEVKGGSHSKMMGGGWWESMCYLLFGKDTTFFDNSITSEYVDRYACTKMELMHTLDKLLTSSLEFEIYKNAAELSALINEQQARTLSGQSLSQTFMNILKDSRTRHIYDVTTTTQYVGSFLEQPPQINVDSSISDLNAILNKIYDALSDVSEMSITDLEKSLYIDVWNILNDYITRIHNIINFEIPDIIKIINTEESTKLLDVVKTCIMKGLFHVLSSLFNSTNALFIQKDQRDAETVYIFYEVNNVYSNIANNNHSNNIKAIYIIEFNHSLPPINAFKITQGYNNHFDIFNETPTLLTQNNQPIEAVEERALEARAGEARARATAAAARATAAAARATAAAAAAAEAAAAAAVEASEAEAADNAKAAAAAEKRNGRIYIKKSKRLEAIENARQAALRLQTLRSHSQQKSKSKKAGSNLEIKLISGIGSMLRNEVINKSKYNISTKRPKMNKKTRKNVFSLLEKRRKQTIANKHRKNKTLRKK